MRIFIIAGHASGLSAFSEAIGKSLEIKVASVSQWLEPIIDRKITTRQDRINALTEATIRELRESQDGYLDYIKSHHDLSKPLIIEGIRNPRDFTGLFDPLHDMVVFLNRDNNPHQTTLFETGILVINSYVNWLASIGLLDQEKRVCFEYKIEDLDKVVDNFVKFYNYHDWCKYCGEIHSPTMKSCGAVI